MLQLSFPSKSVELLSSYKRGFLCIRDCKGKHPNLGSTQKNKVVFGELLLCVKMQKNELTISSSIIGMLGASGICTLLGTFGSSLLG